MKRIKVISILLTTIVFGLVTYTLVSSSVQSVESNPAPPNNLAGNNESTGAEGSKTIIEVTDPEGFPEVDLPPDTEGISTAAIEDVLINLKRLEQVNLEFLSRPGWLHTTHKTWDINLADQKEDENAPYSTEGMFPPTQVYDSWDRIIDHEGTYGYGGFIVNSDDNGNPVQVVVSDSQGNGGNLTLLERGLTEVFEDDPSVSVEISSPIKVSSGIGNIIEWFENAQEYNLNPEIKAGYVLNNGVKEYHLYINTIVMGEPYEFNWLSESVEGFASFYRIDQKTGNILEFTEEAIGLSGVTYQMFSQITLVREVVEAMPEDVQQRYQAALDHYIKLITKGE